ncbi:MAG TPA: alpha/beta hydrolase [Casimicrobiaceae bacterium]|nr:alpha/beta hydrolase [Casimicrobiaceae bacterium]
MTSLANELTAEEVERAYNNRAAVPDHQRWLDEWVERSRRAMETLRPAIDIRYGTQPKETLDLYLPATSPRGTLMYIHGGWWRSLDKADYAFVAPAFIAAGFAVAMVNYDLCPDATIANAVDECRRALSWLAREGAKRGAPMPIVVGGHSAGGHLTAMMYTADWRAQGFEKAPFAGGVSLSGVHDLTPLTKFSHNVDFGLDDAEARRMSPALARPLVDKPIALAVGADETSGFVHQTDLMWDTWPGNRPQGMIKPMQIAGRHHYSVVLGYVDPQSALTQATLALFRG